MGFGKRQDHLANDLALGCGELQKSIEGFALQIAHPLFPALAVLQHRLAYAFAKAQHLGVDLEHLRQGDELVLLGNGLPPQPARHRLE